MATYDISDIPSVLRAGDIITGTYSGSQKTMTLPKGKYNIEIWGAKGYGFSSAPSVAGGYSVADLFVISSSTYYVNLGGNGAASVATDSGSANGGYNGGGKGYTCGTKIFGVGAYFRSGSGGGATHIATASGLLYNLSSNPGSVMMVAGGSGGTFEYSGTANPMNYGGGSTGGDGIHYLRNSPSYSGERLATGGTQEGGGKRAYATVSGYLIAGTGGEFGLGGQPDRSMTGASSEAVSGPGAGGGYYGGGGGCATWYNMLSPKGYAADAGGGSGYINTSMLYNGKTLKANESGYVSNPNSSGAGYIRVKVIHPWIHGAKIGGIWRFVDTQWVKVGGTWREVTEIYNKISGVWNG